MARKMAENWPRKYTSKIQKTAIFSDGPSIVGQHSGPNNNPSSAAGSTPSSLQPPGSVAEPKLTPQQEADKEKKRVARKKERRATLILGLIMGSFIACWFPFFFMYSISPICPACVRSQGFTFAFWLGYSNSALNPITVFNKDFRRAFKMILFEFGCVCYYCMTMCVLYNHGSMGSRESATIAYF